jgi:SAM-dependent methyltransferase
VPLAPIDGLDRLSEPTCAALRARLAAAGFTTEWLAGSERIAPGEIEAARHPLVHWALARRAGPAAALARLFCYADEVPARLVDEALGADLAAALREAGVVGPGGRGGLRAAFVLLPFAEGLWILSDEIHAGRDAAMGPGQTTHLFAAALPGALPGRCLDVGCGAGSLALVAARRGAREAIGTDVNPRAVAIARFNARLNGVAARFLTGDLLEPVRGERFDLVVSQPPYVATPPGSTPVTCLHGGPRGDDIALRLLGGLPRALSSGGHAMLLMDVPVFRGEPILPRFREALDGAGVDLVLLSAAGASPDGEAMAYAALEARGFGAAYEATVRRYRQQLEDLGVTGILQTLALLRPASRRSRGMAASLPVDSLDGLSWTRIESRLAALDVAALDDRALRSRALSFASGACWIEERSRPDPAAEATIRVRFGPGGLGADVELADNGAALIEAIEAAASVGEAVTRYAELCRCQPAEVERAVLDFVRNALGSGLLEPRRGDAAEDAPGRGPGMPPGA